MLMSDQDVANNWRLEETGETNERWKLQEAEQNAIKPWQLQDPRPEAAWQPVDYARERGGASNWVLPGLVVVALIAVIAYVGWIGLTRFGLLTATAPAAEGTTAATISTDGTPTDPNAAIAPAVVPTVTLTIAPTELPAIPTAEPTATPVPTPAIVQVTQEFVSVNDPAGVNARSEPNTTSAVVKLLEPGQRLLVVQQDNEWIQVALAKGSLAWVKAEVVDRASQLVTLDELNQQRSELGLAPLSNAEVQAMTPAIGVTTTATTTTTAGITNPLTSTQIAAANPVTATINITGGLNARAAPGTDAITIKLLNNGARYAVTGHSADKQWLQVVLEDGTAAWIFAQFATISGDINALPVPSATAGVTTTTGTITRSITASPTTAITGSIAITATTKPITTVTPVGQATVTISSLSGANARPAADRNAKSLGLFPFEAVLPTVGRSADSQWVQVKLEDGQLAWMLASAVKVSVNVAALPVVNP